MVLRFGGADSLPPWDAGYEELADGWRRLEWLGNYRPAGADWIWHGDHGFIHVVPSSSADSLYFYSSADEWIWTRDLVAPYYYNITTGSWGP